MSTWVQERKWKQKMLYLLSGVEVSHLNSNLAFELEFLNPNFLGFVTSVWELNKITCKEVAGISKCSVNFSLSSFLSFSFCRDTKILKELYSICRTLTNAAQF